MSSPETAMFFFHSLLKQDTKHAQSRQAPPHLLLSSLNFFFTWLTMRRKPWYRRTMEAVSLRKPSMKTGGSSANSGQGELRKCRSLRAAISFTRVCLCSPISSYNEVFWDEVPRRRSGGAVPRPGLFAEHSERISRVRSSTEGRRVFRGKSLTDDVMMRRFVVEEAVIMQVRRRNQMEFVRRKNSVRRRKLGPSPLCRMAMAGEEEEEEESTVEAI
ncbi:hypothetical protein KSP39_PZI006197 [Platanthera zijinensis]|uniref:Uncharacterized protein n=1 Tax=Platanthera zijinensis TaxID=2320716 RepID=A0AAP0BRA5_9ASPA